MKLTADQARDLADHYLEIAESLKKKRIDGIGQLTPDELKTLKVAEIDARDCCEDFTTKAVGLTIDETKASLGQLMGVTEQANEAIQTLAKVGKIIQIATSAVKLGVAVMSENPAAITSAFQDLGTQLA